MREPNQETRKGSSEETAKVRRQIAKILAQISALESLATDADVLRSHAEGVSGWNVGSHVEHLLLVNLGVLKMTAELLDGVEEPGARGSESNGPAPVVTMKKPTIKTQLALAVGRIPRGRGKAPSPVRPQDRTPDDLRALIAKVRTRFDRLAPQANALAACRATKPHPFFGPMTPTLWLRFNEIHNQHHLLIIDDIRGALTPR